VTLGPKLLRKGLKLLISFIFLANRGVKKDKDYLSAHRGL